MADNRNGMAGSVGLARHGATKGERAAFSSSSAGVGLPHSDVGHRGLAGFGILAQLIPITALADYAFWLLAIGWLLLAVLAALGYLKLFAPK